MRSVKNELYYDVQGWLLVVVALFIFYVVNYLGCKIYDTILERRNREAGKRLYG